ncbi:MAG: GNAT family N-acetyltransferase [Candidatus Omnitrophica bacterium]|nr:GNAT family N-acetyltransferase [Candidatus Omnitrophota bacterium]
MKANATALTVTITSTIRDITENDWTLLFGNNDIEGWGYHKTIEEANLKEFDLYYLVVKRQARTVAILPFFTTLFSFTTIIQGPLQKVILTIRKKFKRFCTMPILFVGFPTAEEFYIGIAKDESAEEIMTTLLTALEEFACGKKIGTLLFYDLTEKHTALFPYLRDKGFSPMESFPNTRITLQEKTLDDYIATLGKSTRKNLKRKLRESASRAALTTEVSEDIAKIKDEVYRLYLNNLNDSSVSFETLTFNFFLTICRNMPGVAKFFITRSGEKIVAFNLCLIKNDTCIDKFIGFDKETSRTLHLYYTTFCHNIDWCIKNGIRVYQMGVTDYDPKIRLGARLTPLYIYIKLRNPFINFFARKIIRFIEPRRFDPTLKKLKD